MTTTEPLTRPQPPFHTIWGPLGPPSAEAADRLRSAFTLDLSLGQVCVLDQTPLAVFDRLANPVCYLDLDGVLVDFVRGAFEAHGSTLHRDDPLGVRWGLDDQLGFGGDRKPLFWAPFGRAFWAGLPWTPEGRRVLDHVERLFGHRVVLLTSPCDTDGSVQGKLEWVRRELPEYRRRVFVGPAKPMLAGPGKVLVDDYDGHVEAFRVEGGQAVQPPRPWNRRRSECDPAGGFDPDRLADELARAYAAAGGL